MADDIDSIHTPAFVVNEAVALRNIAAFQGHCDKVGLKLRPHIKTHKSIRFAKAQLAAGAVGITCQKISEAEAMLADGIDDILITYQHLGLIKAGAASRPFRPSYRPFGCGRQLRGGAGVRTGF